MSEYKENLDRLKNDIEYTLATIRNGYDYPSMEGKIDYVLIHKSRAHQSCVYLEDAIKTINQMKTH